MASVLPYAIDDIHHNVYFLLSREGSQPRWADSGMYADFGGAKSDSTDTDVHDTAAREFSEEGNLRIPFGFNLLERLPRAEGEEGWRPIAEQLRGGAYTARFDFDSGTHTYTTFLKQVPFIRTIQEDFESAYIAAITSEDVSPVYYEKDAVAWVSTERLLSIATSGRYGRGGMKLRPHFRRRALMILREFPWARNIGTPRSNAARFREGAPKSYTSSPVATASVRAKISALAPSTHGALSWRTPVFDMENETEPQDIFNECIFTCDDNIDDGSCLGQGDGTLPAASSLKSGSPRHSASACAPGVADCDEIKEACSACVGGLPLVPPGFSPRDKFDENNT